MKNLITSKYLRFIFILLGFFVFALLIGVFFGCLRNEPEPILGLCIGAILGAVFYLIPLSYYLISLIKISKKIRTTDKQIGLINNWKTGFFRGFGKVSLAVNGTEYFTDTLYTNNEARELVGKSVSYFIIDKKLILFCVDEQ